MQPAHRQLVVATGSPAQTRAQVETWTGALPRTEVLWVGAQEQDDVGPRQLGSRLGRAFLVVVVDAHAGFDADALGQAHGMVWGGGALVVRRGPATVDVPGDERLVAWPYAPKDVGHRFERRIEAVLERDAVPLADARPPKRAPVQGTEEQARVVAELVRGWSDAAPTRFALTADRGRGKSSALGLALRRWADTHPDAPPAIVTAGDEVAVREVLRFAGDAADFVPLPEVLHASASPRIIIVDEAAQLPVPLLRHLVTRHSEAHLAFATTTHGYEGTGRGFTLRFLAWLERQPTAVTRRELFQPIRWGTGDPLERSIFDALLLDATAAQADRIDVTETPRCVRIDRDALAGDETTLRELFGLLVQAHYRTTPADLHRMLDAPNLQLHAALVGSRVVGATLVAEEGGLLPQMAEALQQGQHRPRAHALPDVLGAQLGHGEAATLKIRRSVRIAVHPELRRRGIATALVEHVHRSEPADLWGTLFGATAGLVAFRRRVGYDVAGLSASRGIRTGEPSVLMLRPTTDAAQRLLAELRLELARELPLRLQLLAADGGIDIDPTLVAALQQGLPETTPYSAAEAESLACAYADGPRTFESVASAIRTFVETRDLGELPDDERDVVERRVLRASSWEETTRGAGLANPRIAMRSLRRAIRRLARSPR